MLRKRTHHNWGVAVLRLGETTIRQHEEPACLIR